MTEQPVQQVDMETIVSLCKRRGFVFQSSEIYGGTGSVWDYGPLGVELKRNIKEAWWRSVVWERDDMVGLDAAILMHPQVWVASGHAEGFTDPLVECKACHQRFRADHLWIGIGAIKGVEDRRLIAGVEATNRGEAKAQALERFMNIGRVRMQDLDWVDVEPFTESPHQNQAPCPRCDAQGQFTEPRLFNLMFKTFMGPVEDTAHQVWLRPETAQGIFVNFENVRTATRRKLPFGIAQIGKAFRNEITPGNFIFRTREFEQMEIEYFVKPGTDEEWHQRWVQERLQWYKALGIREENLRLRRHGEDELAHYAKDCYDIEYRFPWGWAELEGLANRTDFDLRQHMEHSGKDLRYYDQDTGEHYIPYVIEPSGGVDRAALAFLVDAYHEELAPTASGGEERRVVLKLHPKLAPVKVAVLPLSRNPKLVPKAREVHALVRKHWATQYDDAQSIGRRYRRQDEIGTVYCVTVDFETVDQDNAVTIRDRDTMEQVRVPIPELVDALRERLEG